MRLKMNQMPIKPINFVLMAALKSNKRAMGIALLFVLVQGQVFSQKSTLDGMFGIHTFKPIVNGNPRINSSFTFNFWMGLKYRKSISPANGLNIGFNYNIISTRLIGLDSPISTFLLMRYLSLPLTTDWKINNTAFSLIFGFEPKIYTSVQRYTSEPYIGTKIGYNDLSGIYSRYGLGLLAGIGYKKGVLNYQLKYSFDPIPFQSYTTTRLFEQKLSFGFTFWPIF